MSGKRMDMKLLILLYGLAFFLLREWLIPIIALTDTDHLSIFLLFIGLAFFLALANAKWWLAVPVKILYVLWAVHYVFFDKMLFTRETIQLLLSDVLSNIPIISNSAWNDITNPLRTLLFFSLLWMTTYLIRHWIEVKRSIILFYLMTIIFIAFIDTFSPFSADVAIIRIMVTGLLLVGLLYISRLARKHATPIPIGAFVTISVPLLLTIVVSSAFANAAPKQDPIWPDPIPYFKSVVNGTVGEGNGTGISKSGYDTDDSTLGGSFVQDNTVVFEAEVASKQYWKIETKNTYTTKGWEQEPVAETFEIKKTGVDFEDAAALPEEKTADVAKLSMMETFPFIVYPYGVRKITTDSVDELMYMNATEQYRLVNDKDAAQVDEYAMEFKSPTYSMKQLRETEMDQFSSTGYDLNQYLQLPAELPDRVKELANEIVQNQNSVYEKAKAIERYFGRSGFVYAQNDIAVPGENQDYVDQFLFDTKRGYCDNFSSSMVVMLRSVDIPARWVKGFAPGESVKGADGDRVYQVTNNEAHSWVEAYMPGIGWMPFEPTIGFVGQNDIDYDIELDLGDPEAPDMKEKKQEEKKKEAAKPEKKKQAKEDSQLLPVLIDWFNNNKWTNAVIGVVVVLAGWQIYRRRIKWMPALLIRRHRIDKNDWSAFSKRYGLLLKQLELTGLKRGVGVTLSDYAIQVDKYYGGANMARLTQAYEKGLYGKNTADHEWGNLKEMWEDLINRTSG